MRLEKLHEEVSGISGDEADLAEDQDHTHMHDDEGNTKGVHKDALTVNAICRDIGIHSSYSRTGNTIVRPRLIDILVNRPGK